MSQSVTSSHFPYLPLRLAVGPVPLEGEAPLDTGFDGDVAMPASLAVDRIAPAGYMTCRLADGSPVAAPVYRGTVDVGPFGRFRIYAIALGDEPLVGRGASDRLRITLDYGTSFGSTADALVTKPRLAAMPRTKSAETMTRAAALPPRHLRPSQAYSAARTRWTARPPYTVPSAVC